VLTCVLYRLLCWVVRVLARGGGERELEIVVLRVGFINSVGADLQANRASQPGTQNTAGVSASVASVDRPRLRPGRGVCLNGDQTNAA